VPTFPKVVDTLQQSMNAATLRHQVLSNNVANANVPGYRGAEVSFEDRLKAALEAKPSEQDTLPLLTPHQLHISTSVIAPISPSQVQPVITVLPDKMRSDGNDVDVEVEMATLAANQLWYQALARSIQDEFSRLRTAISEGRR